MEEIELSAVGGRGMSCNQGVLSRHGNNVIRQEEGWAPWSCVGNGRLLARNWLWI